MKDSNQPYSIIKRIGWILGPLLFLIVYNLPITIINEPADKIVAIAMWMIIWWMTEVVSISVTALIPLALFPLLGIADMKAVAASYGSPIVFLFFGGFVMALALEKVNLHKRIALNIIKLTGTTPDRVILGFMIATAALSMWISNTATTVVMLPIALSVIHLLINDADGFTPGDKNFALSIMLGIAFSANVGGIATIIGTPPNMVMIGFVEETYNVQVSFLSWMIMGVPFTILMLAIIYLALVKVVYPNRLGPRKDSTLLIKTELEKLGPIHKTEKRVMIIFLITMVMWVIRAPLNDWLVTNQDLAFVPNLKFSDAGISMLAALSLFTIPFNFMRGEYTIEWEDTRRLPWGILILFGGGLALASAMSQAGIIDYIGQLVSENKGLSTTWIIALLIVVLLFMTELMSNVALVAIFAPVVAGIALGLDADMMHVLIPVTMASSCAFMLPMATPPNAIVFASGYIKVHEMAKVGFFLNVISVVILIIYATYVIPAVFS